MSSSARVSLALGSLAACAALATHAGEVNESGAVALKGYDPVAYFREGVPAKGREDLRFAHKGATYVFANSAHRDAFIASPEQFLPQYGGFCAFGVSRGYKADIDPAAFALVAGKLYLNYNAKVKEEWQKDPATYIRRADERWVEVRGTTKVRR